MHRTNFFSYLLLLIILCLSLSLTSQDLCDKAGFSNGWMLHMSSSEMDQITQACAETKAKYFRVDFAWSDVQWNSIDEWNWDNIDRLVQSTNNTNLELIGILGYFPPWTDQSADTILWSNFVYEAGLRYIPQGVNIFEIWNEPNITNFFPQPNVQDYVEKILIPGSNAIRKAAAELGEEITIISGGLAPAATDGINISQLDFVKGIYDFGGKDYFDVLGQHPYCWPLAPDETSDFNWFLKTEELREVMIDNADSDKKIWGTEMGWPTYSGASGIDEELQAEYLSKAFQKWDTWQWAGPLIWYAYNDAGDDASDPEDNFGLTNSKFDPKPSFFAFEQVIANCLLDTSLEDEANFTSVNVFPNPSNGNIFIETGVPAFEIRLFSPTGSLLIHARDIAELNIAEFGTGVFILSYRDESRIRFFKIVVF